MNILITGGTGYLGSHTAIVLQQENSCCLIDNLSASSRFVLEQLASITDQKTPFFNVDLFDTSAISDILKNKHIDLVIHSAGLKINSSNNIASHNFEMTKSLIKAMSDAKVSKLIFSSSASIYGEAIDLQIDEEHPKRPQNNYGLAKLVIEQLLEDLGVKKQEWSILSLRHFNIGGMHPSYLLRKNVKQPTNNLIENIIKAALSGSPLRLDYGYETIDGTFLRDYVHVMDVAEAYKYAIDFLKNKKGFNAINIGTGVVTSALSLVQCFEKISGNKIITKPSNLPPTAVRSCVANPSKCQNILGWRPKHTLHEICQSEWEYQLSEKSCS